MAEVEGGRRRPRRRGPGWPPELRWWERTLLVVLGFGIWQAGLASIDLSRPASVRFGWLVAAAGIAVVLAAIGLVELAMAAWYRWRHHRRLRAVRASAADPGTDRSR